MPLAPRTNFKIGYARKFGPYIYRKMRKILDRRFFLFFSFLFFFFLQQMFFKFFNITPYRIVKES